MRVTTKKKVNFFREKVHPRQNPVYVYAVKYKSQVHNAKSESTMLSLTQSLFNDGYVYLCLLVTSSDKCYSNFVLNKWLWSAECINFKLAVHVYRCLHGLVPLLLLAYIHHHITAEVLCSIKAQQCLTIISAV